MIFSAAPEPKNTAKPPQSFSNSGTAQKLRVTASIHCGDMMPREVDGQADRRGQTQRKDWKYRPCVVGWRAGEESNLGSLYSGMERGMRVFVEMLCSGCGKLPSLFLISVMLLGCQSLNFTPIGHTVPQNKWIFLSQSGDQSGSWRSEDLILDYKYDRDHSQVYISGVIRFGGPIRNQFQIIQYFHLDAIPVDAQGKVLDMIALTSAGEINMLYDGPIDFSKMLTLPANTAAIAFSYRGRASGGGSYFDGGFADFWEYPVY
jgi:hypothetical protein